MKKGVMILTGVGQIGMAIARRMGSVSYTHLTLPTILRV